MNRCIGIICASLVGKDSTDFERVIGYPPPWTVLDAAVYLGRNGIGMGVGIGGICHQIETYSLEIGLRDFPVGFLVIVNPSGDQVAKFTRGDRIFETPLFHAMLFRDGKWFNPVGDGILQPAERPEKIYQLWPMYNVLPDERRN